MNRNKPTAKTKTSKYSYLLLMGHISCDINQGALPALLPFLIAEYHFSFASAAGLVFASNLVSSIVQPLFGFLGDKIHKPALMCIGMFMAGGGISLMGFFENYWAMFFAAMFTGIGVAIFHPEGSKLASYVSGENKGQGMSIFSVGGNIGFAVGPIIASALMLTFGLKGTAFFVCLGTLMTIIMATQLPGLVKVTNKQIEAHNEMAAHDEALKDNWSAFTKVSFAMFCRSIINSCMITFLPLFWVNVLSKSMTQGNIMLTINSIAGAFATLLGGRLADRFGFRKIVKICTIAAPPFFFLFAFNRSSLVGTFIVICMAILLSGCQSTFVVMGQSFLPNRIGFASGVMYGLTVSVGGMVAPGIGWIGDNYGLPTSILTLAFISVAGMIFSIMIPRTPLDKPKK